MTTTETVRRGQITDEEVAKYQLGKTKIRSLTGHLTLHRHD